MSFATEQRKTSLPVKLAGIAVLGLLGAAFGYATATVFDMEDGMTWPDAVALAMAVALIAIGVISAGVMATRPSSVPKGCGALQVVVMLLAGTMFLLPLFGARWAEPNLVYAGVVILLVVQSIANLMLWRRADEMLRRVMSETSAMAFWALQIALFLYASAERLGLVDSISAWGMMGILMGVYLIASMIAAARRGIH